MTKIIDMTKYLGILLCANIHNSVRCIPSLVTPFHVEDDGYTKFYWGSGPSRMGAYFVDSKNPESMQASILHVYGKIKEINWEEVDMVGSLQTEIYIMHSILITIQLQKLLLQPYTKNL